jgi:5'-3' exoribonuclease 2
MLIIAEERQDRESKRRKIENESKTNGGPSPALGVSKSSSSSTPTNSGLRHPLPQRPTAAASFAAKADSIGLGAAHTNESIKNLPTATQALAGSNHDVVANRKAIRMANMSAAEVLKAELAGAQPVKPAPVMPSTHAAESAKALPNASETESAPSQSTDTEDIPGFGSFSSQALSESTIVPAQDNSSPLVPADAQSLFDDGIVVEESEPAAGRKRKVDEGDEEEDVAEVLGDDDEDTPADTSLALKVNPDGTVVQEDTVK